MALRKGTSPRHRQGIAVEKNRMFTEPTRDRPRESGALMSKHGARSCVEYEHRRRKGGDGDGDGSGWQNITIK